MVYVIGALSLGALVANCDFPVSFIGRELHAGSERNDCKLYGYIYLKFSQNSVPPKEIALHSHCSRYLPTVSCGVLKSVLTGHYGLMYGHRQIWQ
jgi:hypothetical protein